jgi:hypothetical protein
MLDSAVDSFHPSRENSVMSDTLTIPTNLFDDPSTREADAQAVMEHYLCGKPLDPVIAARVRARSEKITEEVYRKFGELNVAVDLIREVRSQE